MAFAGTQYTTLKPNALPGQLYGSFAGKEEEVVTLVAGKLCVSFVVKIPTMSFVVSQPSASIAAKLPAMTFSVQECT